VMDQDGREHDEREQLKDSDCQFSNVD
jgi:hypothetical protein